MITAIDTNILLDILLEDPTHFESSKQLLIEHSSHSLIISGIVYAELFTQFLRKFKNKTKAEKELDRFLRQLGIIIIDFSKEDFTEAGLSWKKQKRKNSVHCPACGKYTQYHCPNCKNTMVWRNHVMTDFLIGSHAKNHAQVLLSRDKGFYKKHFDIKVVSK